MCKCTPNIRTPFCGNGDCVPPNTNMKPVVEALVPWHSVAPIALVQQLAARVEEHRERGEEHVVIAGRAFRKPEGHWCYQPYWSTGQSEILFMLLHEVEWAVMKRERRGLLGLSPES